MNRATQLIKSKGYTLKEFLDKTGISLRTYRRYEKEDSKFHSFLFELIEGLDSE